MHEGHRTRLRSKFLKYGAEGLEKHELLELYLMYSIPRKNTNDIAHDLINEFKTLDFLLKANIDDISRVKGVGKNSALLLKLLDKLSDMISGNDLITYKISSKEDAYRYIEINCSSYADRTILILYINPRMEVTSIDILGINSESFAKPIRDVLRDIIKSETKYVMIAEKIDDKYRESGLNNDYIKKLNYYFSMLDVKILDIVALCENKCESLIKAKPPQKRDF